MPESEIDLGLTSRGQRLGAFRRNEQRTSAPHRRPHPPRRHRPLQSQQSTKLHDRRASGQGFAREQPLARTRGFNAARIAFTTCAGAGLGTMRKVNFVTVLIDEASQITEPCAHIPLVKECQRVVLVGNQ